MIRRKVVRVYKIRCPSFSYHPCLVFPFVLDGNETSLELTTTPRLSDVELLTLSYKFIRVKDIRRLLVKCFAFVKRRIKFRNLAHCYPFVFGERCLEIFFFYFHPRISIARAARQRRRVFHVSLFHPSRLSSLFVGPLSLSLRVCV